MAPSHPSARSERDKKVKSVIAFASTLATRFKTPHDRVLAADLQAQIHVLPLSASSTLKAKRSELDVLGVELWNLATRLRRDEDTNNSGRDTENLKQRNRALGLLRAFSFLLLDSAGTHAVKGRDRKNCVRLMKVALKAAKCCIENGVLSDATKVLERASEYQEVLGEGEGEGEKSEDAEAELGERLRVEYFVLRTTLAWKSDRMDTAEHMFAKYKGLSQSCTASLAEDVADLIYEMGRDFLGKRDYEAAVLWLERAYDILGEHDLEALSAEAGELRLSIMQSIVQAYMKLQHEDVRSKAWHMLRLLETDYADKMSVMLLKVEALFSENPVDVDQVYLALNRMMRSIVLNDRNFITIMHNIHQLKNHDNVTACKLIDELIEIRLFREEKDAWIEKAVVTRVWISCTTVMGEGPLEQLRELFDQVLRNAKAPFSAPATHATQTLLWKQVEATFSQGQHQDAEAWCGVCLHSLFDKAGEHNKSKIARKMILCALARHDYAAARQVYSQMSDLGKNDRVTKYLMYKVALYDNDTELAVQCLGTVCRQSLDDTTLLYACVVEAQQSGNKRQGIAALEKLLERYNKNAPADVHLPALLRMTVRLLVSELVKDGSVQTDIFEQVCRTFEAASTHAKASRRRPSNPAREQFNVDEFRWFSKNTYNIAIKYCAEVPPQNLVRVLEACIEFINLSQECDQIEKGNDVQLRLMFCHYLSACAFVTLARAEDCKQDCMQHYLNVSKHGRQFRTLEDQVIRNLSVSSKADMIAKHFQIVKLELEAALKREEWDELNGLFEECWKYGGPDRYDTLADLVLIIFSCMPKENVDSKYQSNILAVLQKIINASGKSEGSDIVKMSRWIRCLFQLALTYDETVSLKCIDHAIRIASSRKGTLGSQSHMPKTPPPTSPLSENIDQDMALTNGCAKEPNHYPTIELEWLATTAFNHAIDYYVQENDEMCRKWAEKAMSLAEWTENDDGLSTVLMEKYKRLSWDNEE